MATLEPPAGSDAAATIDIGEIWRTAISRYEKTSMVKLESLAGASSVDEVLNDIHERDTKFKSYRHDGSKLDQFRTLVGKSLNPIDQVCNLVGLAASTVRRQPLPAFRCAMTDVCIAIGLPSQYCHLYSCPLSHHRMSPVFSCCLFGSK